MVLFRAKVLNLFCIFMMPVVSRCISLEKLNRKKFNNNQIAAAYDCIIGCAPIYDRYTSSILDIRTFSITVGATVCSLCGPGLYSNSTGM